MTPIELEPTILSVLIRGAIIAALAIGIGVAFQRIWPAQTLALLWRGTLLVMCALPLVSALVPPLEILPVKKNLVTLTPSKSLSETTLPAPSTPSPITAEPNPTPPASSATTTQPSPTKFPWFVALWALGATFILGRRFLARTRIRSLWRNARSIEGNDWPTEKRHCIKLSNEIAIPMAWGSKNPAILLPGDAEQWSSETKRMVLSHELAHVRHRDSRFLLLSQIAIAIHWMNPLAWLLDRHLRTAQEHVADDSVINSGENADDYADLLLTFTKRSSLAIPCGVSAMASRSTVGKRITRVLDEHQRRSKLGLTPVVLSSLVFLTSSTIIATAGPKTENKIPLKEKSSGIDRGGANRSKLASIIVPKIHLEGASLDEAIAFLSFRVKELDPDKKGMPFAVKDAPDAVIHLQLSNVPASEALKFLAQLGHSQHIVKSTGVEVGPGVRKGLTSSEHRIPKGLLQKIGKAQNVEAYWTQLGAKLQDGSGIELSDQYLRLHNNPAENSAIVKQQIERAIANGDAYEKTHIEKQLDKITIPKLNLQQVKLREAIQFLRTASKKNDPNKDPNQRGVSILLQGTIAEAEPIITVKGNDLTIREALEAVAEQAGMSLEVAPFAIILQTQRED